MAHAILNAPAGKLKEVWDLVEQKTLQYTGNSADDDQRGAALKSLAEQLQLKLEREGLRLHFVIFNLEESYAKQLEGWTDFREEIIYGKRFGVWLFESGTFENLGIGSYQNWCFGGYKGGNWTRGGEPVKLFRNPYAPWQRETGQGRLVTFSRID